MENSKISQGLWKKEISVSIVQTAMRPIRREEPLARTAVKRVNYLMVLIINARVVTKTNKSMWVGKKRKTANVRKDTNQAQAALQTSVSNVKRVFTKL